VVGGTHMKKELVTQEEKDKFAKEIATAKKMVVYPGNPSLFPQSIRIQQ
jgi:hypothetical protein